MCVPEGVYIHHGQAWATRGAQRLLDLELELQMVFGLQDSSSLFASWFFCSVSYCMDHKGREPDQEAAVTIHVKKALTQES